MVQDNQAENYVLGQLGSIMFQVNQAAVVLMRGLISFHRDKGPLKIAPLWGPAGGRGGWVRVACLMSVFINACHLLSALPSLSQFGRGRLPLVAISFYALSLLFGHVASRNLPWQGLLCDSYHLHMPTLPLESWQLVHLHLLQGQQH